MFADRNICQYVLRIHNVISNICFNQSINRYIYKDNGYCSWRCTVSSWKKVGFEWSFEHRHWRRLSDVARKIVPDPGCSDGKGTISLTVLASGNEKDWSVGAGAQVSESCLMASMSVRYTLKNESVKSTLKEFGQWQHFIQLDLT